MRCPHCGEEVSLNRTCPYCLRPVPQDSHAAGIDRPSQDAPSPEPGFAGKLDKDEESTSREGAKDYPGIIGYFLNPRVPFYRKLLMVGGLFYLLFPFDLIPDLIPALGWADDAAVVAMWWPWVSRELKKYLLRRR